jgi:outer membrane protein assembly factor BamB
MTKKLTCLFILLFLYSCSGRGTSLPEQYTSYWTTPTPTHTLILSDVIFSKVMWDQQFYVPSSGFKAIQCVSKEGGIFVVGSPDPTHKIMIFALTGKNSDLLWSFNSSGRIAVSEHGLFVGDGTSAYLLELQNGQIKWQTQLLDAKNITSVMYDNDLFFVNATGVHTYFVLNKDGQVITKYLHASDFHSNYKDIPFFPNLPFGYAIGQNIYIEHRGNALYSGYVYDAATQKPLWEMERDSISNFLIFNDYVLWISPDDKIKIADQMSGKLLDTIAITPSIGFFDSDANKQAAGYYLCGDEKFGLIYVVLGDSHQLFAIETKY